jgi:hypothetical protein
VCRLNLKSLTDIPPYDWPENAKVPILETLADKGASAEDRLLAAELAAEFVIIGPDVVEALLRIVKSGEEPAVLRASAAIALGPGLEDADMGDYEEPDFAPELPEPVVKNIQQTLHAVFIDLSVPNEVRRAALEASVRYPQDWQEAAIREAYTSKEKEWRLTSVFCMQYVRGFDAQILESLQSPDAEIKYHAMEAAGNWELDAAWPYVVKAINSPNTEKPILLAAIGAVPYIRPEEAEILDPLLDSEDEDISEAAMDAVTEAGFSTSLEDSDEDEEDDEDEEE